MDRFSAKVGPGTITNGSGSPNTAQINEQSLGSPIIMPVCADFSSDHQNLNLEDGHQSNSAYYVGGDNFGWFWVGATAGLWGVIKRGL